MLVHKYIFYPADALFFCSAQAVVTKEMQNFYYGESVGSTDHAFVAEKDKCGKVICEENGRFYSLVITVKEGEDAESAARKTFCAYFIGLAEMLSRPEEKKAVVLIEDGKVNCAFHSPGVSVEVVDFDQALDDHRTFETIFRKYDEALIQDGEPKVIHP